VVKVAEMGRYVITNLHVGLLLNEEKPKTIIKPVFTDNLPKKNNMEGNLRFSCFKHSTIYLETTASTFDIPLST
jgi:hypothetical protein